MSLFTKLKQSFDAVSPKQILFTLWAVGMVVLVLGFILYASFFIADQLRTAVGGGAPQTVSAPTQQFDIKGFNQLHLSQ